MQEKLKYLFFLPALIICMEAASQKKRKKSALPTRSVIAEYEGGERNIIRLTLFSDSTFYYQETGQLRGLKSTKMGAYLLNDTAISLYTWRSYDFLKNLKEKVRSSVYRCDQRQLLMYTKEQEISSDSTFYKSYFTLSRKD